MNIYCGTYTIEGHNILHVYKKVNGCKIYIGSCLSDDDAEKIIIQDMEMM